MEKFKKWFPTIFMLAYSVGLFIFSIIYWVELISKDRWDELPMRIIVMVLTIGAICCLAIAKILHNQKKILELLKSKSEQNSEMKDSK